MKRKVSILTILVIMFVYSHGTADGVSDNDMSEVQANHSLTGTYGYGCIYARNVDLTVAKVDSMDDMELESYILSMADVELYVQPCTINGVRNVENRLPNKEYPEKPGVFIDKGTGAGIKQGIYREGAGEIPVTIRVGGPLAGELTITLTVSGEMLPVVEEKVHPSSVAEKEEQKQRTRPPEIIRSHESIQEKRPDEKTQEYREEQEPSVLNRENCTLSGALEPAVETFPHVKLWNTTGEAAGISITAKVLFALSGLAALSFVGLIGSDIRLIRWYAEKTKRRGR